MTIERTPTREEIQCVMCDHFGVEAHHVEARSTAPERRDDPTNKVLICRQCHDEISDGRLVAKLVPLPQGLYRFDYHYPNDTDEFFHRICKVSDRHKALVRVTETTLPFTLAGQEERPPEGTEGVVDDADPPSVPGYPDADPVIKAVTVVASPRGMAMPPVAQLVEALQPHSDEALAEFSHNAHLDATNAYVRHCCAVYVYRYRYKREGWDERAGSLFGYAPRTMRRDALFCERLLEYLKDATPEEQELIAEVTDQQWKVVTQASSFTEALQEAVAYRAETGRAEAHGLAGRLQATGLLPRAKERRYTVAQLRELASEWKEKDDAVFDIAYAVGNFLGWLEKKEQAE